MADESNLPVPTDPGEIASELATLETEMADTRGRDPAGYWNSETKQARYRTLLETKDKAGPVTDQVVEGGEQFTPAQVREAYGAAMDGFDDQDIGFMQTSGERLAGAPNWAIISSSFDGAQLTVAGRQAAFRQLARPVLSEEAHLEPEVLTKKRIAALMAGLSEADQVSLDAWWQSLPEGAKLDLIEHMITPHGEATTWEAGT